MYEMYDLSSTLFFKGQFEISAQEEEYDLLWCVVRHIRGWMCGKWSRREEKITRKNADWTKWKFGSTISSQNDLVRFYSIYYADDRTDRVNWACRINERPPSKDNRYAPRAWTTEVGFQSLEGGNRASLSIVLYYSDHPGFIGPCEDPAPPTIPNLIRNLCADPEIACTVDGHPLTLRPIPLRPGDFPDFWKVVSDENREIPVVYISPRKPEEDGGGGANLIDPQALAGRILGPNALVYYAEDLDFSLEMRQFQPDYGCYGGSVRIYAPQPRVEEEVDQLRHRYIPSRDIQEMGEERTCEILRRALAQDVSFYNQMFRVENCRELRERRARETRMEAYRESLEREKRRYRESLDQELERYKGSLDQEIQQRREELEDTFLDAVLEDQRRLEEERDILQKHCETLEEEEQDLRQQLFNSQEREERQKQATKLARENALQSLRHVFQKPPAEPRAIADAIMALYPGRVDFTERGLQTLEKQCRGKDPAVIWKVLQSMATTLYELYTENGGGTIDASFNHQCEGLSMAFSESRATHQDKMLMRQYRDTYRGEEIEAETHIKTTDSKEASKGFLRAYYCPLRVSEKSSRDGAEGDQGTEKRLKIIISSIGDHLTTAGTRRMH